MFFFLMSIFLSPTDIFCWWRVSSKHILGAWFTRNPGSRVNATIQQKKWVSLWMMNKLLHSGDQLT